MVDTEAVVFLRTSNPRAGSGGDFVSLLSLLSLGVDAARLSHPKGAIVTLRPGLDTGGGIVGEVDRSAGFLGGGPHGTDGRAAENPWNLDRGAALVVLSV